MVRNKPDYSGTPRISPQEQFLNYLALWVLEWGYGCLNPSQREIDKVEQELRQIYRYEGIQSIN